MAHEAHKQAPNFDFDPPIAADEQAATRELLSYLQPKKEDDVRMVAAALKTHGAKFEGVFLEWATPYGRYKAKGLWAKVRPDPDAATELIERQIIARDDKYQILGPAEIKALPPIEWAIKGVLPRRGVSMIYGPSSGGKSFVALNMIYAIAEGNQEWFGHRVKQSYVLYVALEGESGIRGRVLAMEREQGRTMPEYMRVLMPSEFNITNTLHVEKLAKDCPPGCIVVIDTLNRAAPNADENSSRDMGAILAGAKRLAELVKGNCVLIHHSGKNAQMGERGHSSLRAALDCSIEVTRTNDRRAWKVAKAKDGLDGEEHAFRLNVVEVGTDEDGEAITSCVVVEDASGMSAHNSFKPVELSKDKALMMQSFEECASENRSAEHFGSAIVDQTNLKKKFQEKYKHTNPSASAETLRTVFNRNLKALNDEDLLKFDRESMRVQRGSKQHAVIDLEAIGRNLPASLKNLAPRNSGTAAEQFRNTTPGTPEHRNNPL